VPLTREQRDGAVAHFDRFLSRRIRNLERLTLDHLKFNVLLARVTATMLEFDTPESLLRSRLAQHLERGSSTGFGTTLQAIARDITGQATGVAGADIALDRDGRRHYIQVKSGPDTANKDIAENIARLLNAARARDPTAICLMGVCYGRPDQISQIAQRQLEMSGVGVLVGREFWEFISGDPGCLEELLVLAAGVASAAGPGETSFAERVDRKLDELVAEFHERYGDDLTAAAWRGFLVANS
jgi:hypothetical protein